MRSNCTRSKQTKQSQLPLSLSRLSICCFWDPNQDSIHQILPPKTRDKLTLENKSHANHVYCGSFIHIQWKQKFALLLLQYILQYLKHGLYSLITSKSFVGFTKETQNNIHSSHITQRLHLINTVHRARKSLPNVDDSKVLVSSSPAKSEHSTPNQNNQLQQYSLTRDDIASMTRINSTANRSCQQPT